MVRLYDDGENSHWGNISYPFVSGGDIGKMTDRIPCEGVWLRWTAGSYNYKWHNAPRRQLIASLNGHVEAHVGSGEKRRFGPGELLLAEDTKGRGHCTKSLDGEGRWSVFIALGGPWSWLLSPLSLREKLLLVLLALTMAALFLERQKRRAAEDDGDLFAAEPSWLKRAYSSVVEMHHSKRGTNRDRAA